MRTTFVVVDDFYDDPDNVRERALQLDFQRPEYANFPGVFAAPIDDIEHTMTAFATLLGGIEIKCRRNEGTFRISTEPDMASRRSLVHVDTPDFSAVIHLSTEPTEGTYFYRHKALGLERVSSADNLRPEVREAIETDTLDLDAWELIHEIPMKYNRLVIFDGKYFHSGPHRLTGTGLADGRLTQNFFFYRA